MISLAGWVYSLLVRNLKEASARVLEYFEPGSGQFFALSLYQSALIRAHAHLLAGGSSLSASIFEGQEKVRNAFRLATTA